MSFLRAGLLFWIVLALAGCGDTKKPADTKGSQEGSDSKSAAKEGSEPRASDEKSEETAK